MILALVLSSKVGAKEYQEKYKGGYKDLGVCGEVFLIQEESLLEVIQAKLHALQKNGKLKEHQKDIVEKVKKGILHPQAVSGITTTKVARRFIYNPSIQVPYDLKDYEGHVFAQGGTRINPLKTHPLTKPLLFIDGEDAAQVKWALEQRASFGSEPKIILVKGSPFELMDRTQRRFYFDQGGVLVKKLGIAQVPACVSQEKDSSKANPFLTIKEILLGNQEALIPPLSNNKEK